MGYHQATKIRGFPIHPSLTGHWLISVLSHLKEGFYLALVSARLGMTLNPIWECISLNDVIT